MKPTIRYALFGALATLVALAAGGLLYMYSGAYNVAATQDHTALGRWLLKTGQKRSVAVRADDVPEPPPTDSSMVVHGFEHYHDMCVVCHGAPGVERSEFGSGITPTPPDLSEEVAEFSTRELFWITKHGIKLAGMPAFGSTHSDEELWAIVGFVEQLEGMNSEEYARWEASVGSTGSESTGEAAHSHGAGTSDH